MHFCDDKDDINLVDYVVKRLVAAAKDGLIKFETLQLGLKNSNVLRSLFFLGSLEGDIVH